MKFVLVAVAALVAVATAAPAIQEQKQIIEVLRRSDDGPNPDGSYSYSFETQNGIKAEEKGEVKPAQKSGEEPVASVRGSYSYIGDDGNEVQVTYTADENGFHPEGAHLPQIPVGIVRALEWIALHPEEDNLQ